MTQHTHDYRNGKFGVVSEFSGIFFEQGKVVCMVYALKKQLGMALFSYHSENRASSAKLANQLCIMHAIIPLKLIFLKEYSSKN